MATTYQDTNVNQLVINKMTKQEYDNLSQVSETELYLVEEQVDSTVIQGSTNPVQGGAVYEALQDIGGNINDGTTLFVKNNRTVGTTSANQALDKTITIPNDIIMCKMSDGIVYDSYIIYTKIKQYLPDYPYYSDDLNWEIGGNPPMRASITEGNYYLDVDTNHIFVADENLELLDITSSVVMHGDPNKLYCDVDTNKLYRHDGTNFIALTSEGKTYTLSSNNENIRLTDSDGQTQDLSLNTLINGLSTGSSDPQDDDYIVAQYAGGGTTTTTYHRRPLSKFWNWIKTKLGIGTNDGTFLRKDGTWATPTATDSTKVAKAGDTMTGTLILAKTQDASSTANNKPALIIGGTDTDVHIEIDSNEIIAKSNGTTGDKLWLQDGYGELGLCGSDYSVFNPTKFMKAITNDNIGTNAHFVLTITSLWGRSGYSSIADIRSLVSPEFTSKSYNTSGGSCTVYKWGRICMASFSTTVSSSSGTIFTITDAAYRPLINVRAVCQASVSATAVIYTAITININGAITYQGSMYRNGTSNVVGNDSSNRPIEGTICYISAS